MEPLLVALFSLAVMASIWTTVFAALEYNAERVEEFNNIARTIVLEEAYYQYLRPILCRKMKFWSMELTMPNNETMTDFRTIFISMQRSLILQSDEYSTYVLLCQDAAHSRRLWISKAYMHRVIEDLCCDYMYHTTFSNELWNYLTSIHNR
jgi:hypothetical protein